MAPPISVNADLLTTNRPPTEEEYAELTQHVTRLSELDKKIAHLTKALEALEEERDTLVAEIAPVKQALAPIRRVPEDILREIFVACLDPYRNPAMSNTEAPVLLTQISSDMRRIALTTPALWAAIHIKVITPVVTHRMAEVRQIMERREHAAHDWLLRSGSLPLRISVFEKRDFGWQGYIEDHSIPPMMAVICKFSLRWKHVDFSCFPESLLDICALGLDDLPLVKSVIFNVNTRMTQEDAGTFISHSKILSAPMLTHLALKYTGEISRFANTVAWKQLTHIQFPEISFGDPNGSSMYHVGNILRQTTCLVSCDLSINSDLQDLDTIYLPYLKALIINNGHVNPGVMGFLAAIRAPVLDVVSYNMKGFVLDHPYPLVELLKHSLSVTELEMGPGAKPSYIINCLQHCPELRTLNIQSLCKEIPPGSDIPIPESAILDALVPDEDCLSVCPKLENLRWCDVERLSPSSLQKILWEKRHSDRSDLAKWNTVIVEYIPVRPVELDIFIDYQSGKPGNETNVYIGGPLHRRSKRSDGTSQLDPVGPIWPSKIPQLHLW